MPEYVVHENPDRASWNVVHTPTDSAVSIIHKYQKLKRFGGDATDVYRIDQPGASEKFFGKFEHAIKHSITVHKGAMSGANPHPMQIVGDILNQLGHKIWTAGADPRINTNDLELKKIRDVLAEHEKTVSMYNKHYGPKK